MQSFLRRGKGAHNGIFCRDRRGLDEPCQPGFGPFGLDAARGGDDPHGGPAARAASGAAFGMRQLCRLCGGAVVKKHEE